MKIKKMTDEECLKAFIEMLETRISITTGFISENDNGNITHQILQVSCGEYATVSAPERLEVELRVATAEELGATVN